MNATLKSQIASYASKYQSKNLPAKNKKQIPFELSSEEQEILKEAETAWLRYEKSQKGQNELATVPNLDISAIQQKVQDVLNSSEFVKLKQLISSLDIPTSSFTFGFNIQVEFIIGFTATIGLAIGIGESKGVASSEFLTIGLTEGIDEGGLAGVQFGIWKNAPADLGGYAWSTEADAGFLAEAGVAVSYTASGGILGASITIGGGEEDGVDEEESYTFILGSQEGEGDGYLRPAYQPRKGNLLLIKSIYCSDASNDDVGSDTDEVYFTFQADGDTKYYYPTYDRYSMQKGDTWNCGRSVWFDSYVVVKIYDEDNNIIASGDENLGNFTINLSDLTGLTAGQTKKFNSTTDFSSWDDTIGYSIEVELLAQDV